MRVLFPSAALVLAVLVSPAGARPREKTLLADFEKGTEADRIRLAPALGRMKDRKAVDALLNAMNVKRGNPRETAAIVDALGRAGDPRAVTELASGVDYLRSMTLQMGELPPNLQVLRIKLIEALSRVGGEQAVTLLSESINDKDQHLVEEAIRGLGRLQVRDALPALQQLASQGGELTQAVYEAMGEIGDKRAISSLEQGLASPDKFVNVEAAYGLAKLGRKDGFARLEDSLKNDPGSEKVGILAAYYLAKLDKTSGLDHLVKLMQKKDSGYSAMAAEALGKSENPRAALPLIESLKADDSAVRLAIARALARLPGSRSTAALKKLVGDANATVRSAALTSLSDLGEID